MYLASRKTLKLEFPEPEGLPFFGSYFALKGRRMHDVLLEWNAKFGGVFTFSIFSQQYLVVCSPEALQDSLGCGIFHGFVQAQGPNHVLEHGLDVVNADMQSMGHLEENVIAAADSSKYFA